MSVYLVQQALPDFERPDTERSTFLPAIEMSTGVTKCHRDVYISADRRSGTARLRIGLEWFSVFSWNNGDSVLKKKSM